TILFAYWRENKKVIAPLTFFCGLFFVLGFSIYTYLLIRSNQKPFFNWNRPETLERFWGSLVRKTHGGTLDLLSQSYQPGELFWTDMAIYFKQVFDATFMLGIPLAIFGLFHLWKNDRTFFFFSVLAWAGSGAFFIYKANLPPNPHALAVLEAHFNLSFGFM